MLKHYDKEKIMKSLLSISLMLSVLFFGVTPFSVAVETKSFDARLILKKVQESLRPVEVRDLETTLNDLRSVNPQFSLVQAVTQWESQKIEPQEIYRRIVDNKRIWSSAYAATVVQNLRVIESQLGQDIGSTLLSSHSEVLVYSKKDSLETLLSLIKAENYNNSEFTLFLLLGLKFNALKPETLIQKFNNEKRELYSEYIEVATKALIQNFGLKHKNKFFPKILEMVEQYGSQVTESVVFQLRSVLTTVGTDAFFELNMHKDKLFQVNLDSLELFSKLISYASVDEKKSFEWLLLTNHLKEKNFLNFIKVLNEFDKGLIRYTLNTHNPSEALSVSHLLIGELAVAMFDPIHNKDETYSLYNTNLNSQERAKIREIIAQALQLSSKDLFEVRNGESVDALSLVDWRDLNLRDKNGFFDLKNRFLYLNDILNQIYTPEQKREVFSKERVQFLNLGISLKDYFGSMTYVLNNEGQPYYHSQGILLPLDISVKSFFSTGLDNVQKLASIDRIIFLQNFIKRSAPRVLYNSIMERKFYAIITELDSLQDLNVSTAIDYLKAREGYGRQELPLKEYKKNLLVKSGLKESEFDRILQLVDPKDLSMLKYAAENLSQDFKSLPPSKRGAKVLPFSSMSCGKVFR